MANRFKKAAEARKEASSIEVPAKTEATKLEPAIVVEPKIEPKAESPVETPAPATTTIVQPKVEKKAPIQNDETMVGMSMKIPTAMRDALRLRHAKTGETTTSYIKRLIEEDMKNNPF